MPIRILHIVSYMQRGGLETFIMNCYRQIDREKIQFDFIVHREFRADYDDEIEALGGRIYRLPRLNPFSPGYRKALLDFFRSHPEYKVVHCHLDCMSGIPLAAAKQCGVPVRIAHAHSSNQDRDWKYPLKRFFMRSIPVYATHLFACSKTAGQWMFPGQTVTVINNGIDTAQFSFNPAVRNAVREELHLTSGLTVGHAGRFEAVKNHSFLIDVFNEVHLKNPDSALLLAGTGSLEQAVREKVDRLGLHECVHFLGTRSDIGRILQTVDVFVLPSFYEGLGIAAVEAQASGAYCLLSDMVPQACKMTDIVEFISLDVSPSQWADAVIAGSRTVRGDHSAEVAAAGFDIRVTAEWLQEFYLEKYINVRLLNVKEDRP